MKKFYSIFLLALILLAVSGCNNKGSAAKTISAVDQNVEITAEQEVENLVEQTLNHYKEQDFIKFSNNLTEMPNKLNLPGSKKTESIKRANTNIDYTIKDSIVENDNATVIVEITSLYIPELLSQFIVETRTLQINAAATSTEEEAKEEPSEEELKKESDELFDSMANSSDARKETREVSIPLVKSSGKWLITPNDELINALLSYQEG